jgi:uncharacterized protein
MDHPVVHVEIIGDDPGMLRRWYGELFGWDYGVGDAVNDEVSAPGDYGFVDGIGAGVNGGIGGGPGFGRHVLFYVGVTDVEATLRRVEEQGGTRALGPVTSPDGGLIVGRFTDPEGHLVGVAAAGAADGSGGAS